MKQGVAARTLRQFVTVFCSNCQLLAYAYLGEARDCCGLLGASQGKPHGRQRHPRAFASRESYNGVVIAPSECLHRFCVALKGRQVAAGILPGVDHLEALPPLHRHTSTGTLLRSTCGMSHAGASLHVAYQLREAATSALLCASSPFALGRLSPTLSALCRVRSAVSSTAASTGHRGRATTLSMQALFQALPAQFQTPAGRQQMGDEPDDLDGQCPLPDEAVAEGTAVACDAARSSHC